MWTYILGPFLALLPKPWRDALTFDRNADPARAATLSGLAESVAAIIALGYWYMHIMAKWTDRGVDAASSGKLGPVTDQEIASLALSIFATHPLTWLFAYVILEGAVRLCAAAFTGAVFGTLPLLLLDKILIDPFRKKSPRLDPDVNLLSNISSFWNVIREKITTVRVGEVPDQLRFYTSEGEKFLEILSSRRKTEWTPPRIVRYEETYYRLESSGGASGPRPFRYSLRRLSVGVPGRSVLLYAPPDVRVVQ